jgi:hypothetical protein
MICEIGREDDTEMLDILCSSREFEPWSLFPNDGSVFNQCQKEPIFFFFAFRNVRTCRPSVLTLASPLEACI